MRAAVGKAGGGEVTRVSATGGSEPETTESLRALGAVLKVFRERAGLTQEGFASIMGYSVQTVASIEQGRRMPQPGYLAKAKEVLKDFGVFDAMMQHITRQPSVASWFRAWAGIEDTAIALWSYEMRVIPGLLQTEGYMRALIRGVPPLMDAEQADRFVAGRLERRQLLFRKPLVSYSAVIEQSVLERWTGGIDVHREQLDSLISDAGAENIELQVMPLRQEVHAGLDGPLHLAETPDHRWIGYTEGQVGSILATEPKQVSALLQRYGIIRSQALSPPDSLSLLKQMRGAL